MVLAREQAPQMKETPSDSSRAVTIRSLTFGLLGACIVSGLAGYHDSRIPSDPLMVGTHLPVAGYFFIILVALLWNGLVARFLPSLAMTSRELVVVMGMTLMGCFPPTSALFRYFQRQLILPWQFLAAGGRPEWQKYGVLQSIPSKLFPSPAPKLVDGVLMMDEEVYRGFIVGLSRSGEAMPLTDIPWGGWLGALAYWAPLVILMSVCVMSLSLLVHRQWASHEQLSYPLAQVGTAFITRRHGKGVPDLFLNKLFWWGFTPIIILYALEYAHLWFPESVPGIIDLLPNLKTWSLPLAQKMPMLQKCGPTWWNVSTQSMYFSIMAIAYFTSSEVGLTMGLSTWLLVLFGGWFFVTTGAPLRGDDVALSRAGAYFGYALILMYTGRTYYWRVLKMSLQFRRTAADDAPAVMAARLVIISFIGFWMLLCFMGLDWLIALFFSLSLMILFLVFTRIICETGIPFMQAGWYPGSLLAKLIGPAAVGPTPLALTYWLGTILVQDPRECLMPYVATATKMADDANVRLKRVFAVLLGAVVVALVVGFISTSWTMYTYGGMTGDTWASTKVPTIYLDRAATDIADIDHLGLLDESRAASGISKLHLFSPEPVSLGYFSAGFIAVLAMCVIRFRFVKFPFHPVLFLVWGTYPGSRCWFSFLVGWAIKQTVVHFGGGQVYQRLKPVFFGIIAGELIATGLAISVELTYYWVTGESSGLKFSVLAQ